ncbi:hypothetical protein GEMRC1_003571 [Eukaryota sp. GEM-RC1]
MRIEERFNLNALQSCNVLVEAEYKGGFDIAPKIAVFNVAVSERTDFLELVIFRSKKGVKFFDSSVCNLIYVFVTSKEFSSNFLQCFNSLCKSVARKEFLQQALTVRTHRNLQELFFVCERKRYYYSGTDDVVLEASPVRRNSVIEAYSRSNSVSSFHSDSGIDRVDSKFDLPPLAEGFEEEEEEEEENGI